MFIAILITVSLLTPVISVFLWQKIVNWAIKKTVLETLQVRYPLKTEMQEIFSKTTKNRHYLRYSFFRLLTAILIGFDIHPETQYYLENETFDIDVGSIRDFVKTRMFGLITPSLGIGFLIASIVKFSISNTFIGFIVGAFVIIGSPILISWLTPVIWILKDSRIRYLKSKHDIYDLSDKVKRSLVSRFFSISAWLAGLSFFVDLLSELSNLSNPTFGQNTLLYLASFLAVLIVIVLLSGASLLVGMLYLTFFHEKNINNLRKELSKIIPYAQSNAVLTRVHDSLKT